MRNVEGYIALVNGSQRFERWIFIDTWDWVVGDGAMDQLSELTADQIVAVRLGSLSPDVRSQHSQINRPGAARTRRRFESRQTDKHLASIGFRGPGQPQRIEPELQRPDSREHCAACSGSSRWNFHGGGIDVAALPKDMIEDIPYDPTPIS